MSGIRRIIVGASGSPGSLQALRSAEELARVHDAILIPVLAWVPPGSDLADRRAPCGYLRRVWAEDADRRLRDALQAVWGEQDYVKFCSSGRKGLEAWAAGTIGGKVKLCRSCFGPV